MTYASLCQASPNVAGMYHKLPTTMLDTAASKTAQPFICTSIFLPSLGYYFYCPIMNLLARKDNPRIAMV
jgi:hypothetical protein